MRRSNLILWLFLVWMLNACKSPRSSEELQPQRPLTPLMGWASWNNFRANISEDIIRAQADAMVANGMKDAGYRFINIDDGYFGGRDENGRMLAHPVRFPSGMAKLAEYIHSKGLKAGIYTDAGINTCASYYDNDTIGSGMGLWGHDRSDLTQMLVEWKYDFIKIDWCGGVWLGLDKENRYTQLSKIIREIRPDAVYNVCAWGFPGKWVADVADSWRVSIDIENSFESVMSIVDLNADLWRYSTPGSINDMDMLQVGRGMSYEEDKTHFTMWSIMNSPLVAGNDLTTIDEKTLSILTNKDIIALNQDAMGYQARRLSSADKLEVWAKPLVSTMSGKVAVVLLNRGKTAEDISFDLTSVGIDPLKGYQYKDLWDKNSMENLKDTVLTFRVPSHGVVALLVEGKPLPLNVFQYDKALKCVHEILRENKQNPQ